MHAFLLSRLQSSRLRLAIYMRRQKLAFEASPDPREISLSLSLSPPSLFLVSGDPCRFSTPRQDSCRTPRARARVSHGKAGSACWVLPRARLGILHFTIAKILCKARARARGRSCHAVPYGRVYTRSRSSHTRRGVARILSNVGIRIA